MLGWLTYKNPAFPNTPQKRPNRGWHGSEGVFPCSGCKSRTQAHTGGTAGTIRLCCLLVFGISSFSGPIPKVLFFVYAAQFLYRRLHLSIPLIMFYRTLLGDMETLSFPFHCCDRMCFLKLPQNWPKPVLLWVWVLFLYLDQESLTQAHTAGHARRSCLAFVPDAFSLCTSRDIFSICCW